MRSMRASALRTRRVAWISIAAGAALVYLFHYTSRSDPLPPAASPVSERSAIVAPAPSSESAPGDAASELKLTVNGVIIGPVSRGALISLGDQPDRLIAEGGRIADGVVLTAVNPDRVVVKRGGELLRFRVRGAVSGSGPGALPDAAADSTDPAEPTPPAGTEERRHFQSRD